MNKRIKIASLLMALVLLMGSVAFAADSKGLEEEPATAPDVASTIIPSVPVAVEIKVALSVTPTIAYFPPVVQAEIKKIAPAVTKIDEIASFGTLGAWSSGSSVWSFPTVYKVDQKIAAVFGVGSGTAIDWYPVSANVIAHPGIPTATLVKVYIPQTIWVLGIGKTGTLVILS
ncbi:MAG: hypothetical protein LBB86_07795 [Oscillospiraceae bacterium]|jgi:hypothetical protein|nr:hypothetical protein [Oscillospiraceae bacterium]